eukprot:CAMPEP_0198202664 /NCGR_PEP_ID=MMETSP1445-20131203/5878_1 /TAXON_ID=36898 /ORGANISM="Pyramimonas sp., Strain CCMP2087" /LENGTH=578 /DNA_ID=CAMNT_0043873709 /DNA_START=171 /DNA_END=1907 /DNA_ORIENTATION=-
MVPLLLALLVMRASAADDGPVAFFNNYNVKLDLDAETPGPQYPVPPVVIEKPKIFIGTSAYRDMACPGTLFDAFNKAEHPERLYMGVIDQAAYGDEDCVVGYCRLWHEKLNDTRVCPYFQHIKLTRLPSFDAKGPTKARHFQGDLIDGQDFCMQVDSHTMFTENWDTKFLDMWYSVKNEYAVLTTYLPGAENYGIENFAGRNEVPHICNLMWAGGDILRNSIAAACSNLPRPKLTTIWAAGLSFSKCHGEIAVPYDPFLPQVFDGEEISKAARMWTRGYDFYTPHRNYIWHIYKRMRRGEWYADGSKSGEQRTYEKEDPEAMSGQERQAKEKATSTKRLQTLFRIKGGSGEDLGMYNLGTVRSYHQWLEFVGVNYTTHTIDTQTRCGNLVWVPNDPPSQDPPSPSEDSRGAEAEIQRLKAELSLATARISQLSLLRLSQRGHTPRTRTRGGAVDDAVDGDDAGVHVDDPTEGADPGGYDLERVVQKMALEGVDTLAEDEQASSSRQPRHHKWWQRIHGDEEASEHDGALHDRIVFMENVGALVAVVVVGAIFVCVRMYKGHNNSAKNRRLAAKQTGKV